MDEIERLRSSIDQIDQDILQLLKRRNENAGQLGQLKKLRGQEIRDPERESAILRKVQNTARRLGLNPDTVKNLFGEIFKLSIEAQSKQRPRSTNRLYHQNILIVGGTGGMGSFFARFTRSHGASVKIVGRDLRKTKRVAREIGVVPGSIDDARSSDIVIVAVPIDVIQQTSTRIASQMRPGTLLMDLSSVKSGISDEVSSRIPKGIEYVSVHPLFGPDITTVEGENLAAVSYEAGPQWKIFSRAFGLAGGRIHFVTSDNHDKTMALVQVLHHFALISLAKGLAEWSGQLKTRSIRRTVETIQALLRNWDTIMAIQRHNPYAGNMRREFARTVQPLVQLRSSEIRNTKRILDSHVQKWSRKL